MSWFKRNKPQIEPQVIKSPIFNNFGDLGAIYTLNQEETIKQFNKARFIINNAETMYLRGIEDGTELNIDIAIKQLERVKQLVNIQKPTNEDAIHATEEQVKIIINK